MGPNWLTETRWSVKIGLMSLRKGNRSRLRVFHGSPLGLPLVQDSEIVGDIDQELGEAVRFAGDYSALRRAFMSVYGVLISSNKAAGSSSPSGLSFT